MKKAPLAIVSALLTASIALFASCGEVTTSFSSNWYNYTSNNSGINGTEETLKYSVTYQKSPNPSYGINYTEGTFVTTLTNALYPESGKDDEGNDVKQESVYKYTTQLSINVAYTIAGQTSETYADTIETVVYFRNADEALSPIHSEKKVSSHSMIAQTPTSLEKSIAYYHYTFVTDYAADLRSGTLSFTPEAGDESGMDAVISEFSINDKYSYIDNEQFLFAVRGMDIVSGGTETVNVYNASRRILQPVTVGNNAVSSRTYEFAIDGKKEEVKLNCNEISIAINGTQAGGTQTAVYAAKTSEANNTYRNVMITLTTPIPYGNGALVYQLTEAEFTNK